MNKQPPPQTNTDTAPLSSEEVFQRLQHVTIGGNICVYSRERCEKIAPLANCINALKEKHGVLVLAHSYVVPEIIYLVADHVGDSYQLSQLAKNSNSEKIVYAAVRFMAETGKIINPLKRFFISGVNDGCSLADSIDADTVATLRQQYADHTFVCYINTTAAVKAQCDVCVTSSNVYDIVERLENRNIYFLPDQLMGKNLINEMEKRKANKNISLYSGNCYVHKDYDPEMIDFLRLKEPALDVLAHPECSPSVVEKADYVGSTSGIMKHVANSKTDKKFFILSECGLVSRLQSEIPQKEIIGGCTLCRYMKSNTLESILDVLLQFENADEAKLMRKKLSLNKLPTRQKTQTGDELKNSDDREIILDDDIILQAKKCIDKMFELA